MYIYIYYIFFFVVLICIPTKMFKRQRAKFPSHRYRYAPRYLFIRFFFSIAVLKPYFYLSEQHFFVNAINCVNCNDDVKEKKNKKQINCTRFWCSHNNNWKFPRTEIYFRVPENTRECQLKTRKDILELFLR